MSISCNSSTMTHRDMCDTFDDYLNYLIPDETQSTIVPSDWNATHDYIQGYFKVWHSYITPDAPRDPLKLAHQEILKEEQDKADHVIDVLPRYCRIMELRQEGINIRLFSDWYEVRDVLDALMGEVSKTLL